MLSQGAYALTFNAANVEGNNALFSKDASGNRDGGHLYASVDNGKLVVRLQSPDGEKRVTLNDYPIEAGVDYHLGITFGENGLNIYLNGELAVSKVEFKQTMEQNYENIVLGANGSNRGDNNDSARHEFTGSISDFEVYGSQLNAFDMALKSGNPEAIYALEIEQFMPAFMQYQNNATDDFTEMAAKFGYVDGDTTIMKDIESGTDGDDVMDGSPDSDYFDGGLGNDTLNGNEGNDELQGGYGNDYLFGGAGDDLLDGGHGEDYLNGGAGDDVLVARADAREPFVTFDPVRDESDPLYELDPVTGKLYPNQPLNADDVLTGGEGADTFYFQTQINAKERFIEEHTNNDGTIEWGDVAGENDKIHDHWVEAFGDDTITDFNRAEGDQIIIEGHTATLLDLTYGDSNNDGVSDYSVISLYSDQGANGGAHNHDLIGTITVFGDLLREDDFTIAKTNYGIVNTVNFLDEAITPLDYAEDRVFDEIVVAPVAEGYGEINGKSPVFALPGTQEFTGEDEDYLDFQNDASLMLAEGTYVLNFNADDVTGDNFLFSKDANGNREGGHLKAEVDDGQLKVRFQTEDGERSLTVSDYTIEPGQDYHLAIAFGDKGLKVYLNGEMVESDVEFKQTMEMNYENLVIGATGHARDDSRDAARNEFDGTIADFKIYGEQLNEDDIATLSNSSDALYALQLDNFMPVFSQFENNPSDEYVNLASKFGYSEEGALPVKNIVEGTDGNDSFVGETLPEGDSLEVSNSNIIGEATDIGAIGNNAYQTIYGKQPVLQEGAIGSKAGITFDGVNDFLMIDDHADINTASHSARTLSVVFSAEDVLSRQVIYEEGGGTNGLNVYIDQGKLYLGAWSKDNGWEFTSVSANIAEGETYQATLVLDGSAGLLTGYLNGEEIGQQSSVGVMDAHSGNIALGALSDDSHFHDGAANADGGYYFNGTIGEFVSYNDAKSGSELAQLHDYGKKQWEYGEVDGNVELPSANIISHFNASNVVSISETDGIIGVRTEYDDYYNGGMGNDTISGEDGHDELQGGYGNDDLFGGNGDDLLDGGYGEDILNGGAGNDVLVSRADAGEPFVAFDPDRAESDPLYELDSTTRKLYPDQPLPADDVLTGGEGADTFYFQTLINSKYRYMEEHTNDDGSIDWGNVAGENDKIHDHWVEGIGHDTITDYNKAEGDVILIEGHTTELLDIEYIDEDSDGTIDVSKIHIYSNQGSNGGAHNDDLLGTISVYGDIVSEADLKFNKTDYGIVKSIDDIDDAVTPLDLGSERTDPIEGTSGNDVLFGTEGDDVIEALDGNDLVYAKEGDDIVNGGEGVDYLFGQKGDDTLNGNGGSDYLRAGMGEDVINGGAGNDIIMGCYQADILTGGDGSDIFRFNKVLDSHATFGVDTITDFEDGSDIVDLSALSATGINSFADLSISDDGVNTTISANNNNFELDLLGVHTLDSTDFNFA